VQQGDFEWNQVIYDSDYLYLAGKSKASSALFSTTLGVASRPTVGKHYIKDEETMIWVKQLID
jgi:hypothetical protein